MTINPVNNVNRIHDRFLTKAVNFTLLRRIVREFAKRATAGAAEESKIPWDGVGIKNRDRQVYDYRNSGVRRTSVSE